MGVERAVFIDSLNPDNPNSYDKLKDGDDHIRMIKQTLRNTLPRFGKKVELSVDQLNKLYEWLFAVEDQADEPEDLTRLTVLGDVEIRKDIYLTEGEDDTSGAAPSTPDSPKITGLANIQFSTEEQEDPESISEEKLSRAVNLATADSRYLKTTAEGDIVGGINKLTWKNGDEEPVTVALATEETLTVKNRVVVDLIQSADSITSIDMKEGTANFKTLEIGGDLRVTGSFFRGSDERIKQDIKPLESSGVASLLPVEYLKQSRKEYGFIAQQIPEEYQHIVAETHDLLSVDYTQLIPVLVKEVQELKAQLKDLKNAN